jgi:hypothetical protein
VQNNFLRHRVGASALSLLGLVCIQVPGPASAQSVRSSNAGFERSQRLLRDLRKEPAAPLVLEKAVAEREPVECGIGLQHEFLGHAPDATFTPAYCEAPYGAWKFGIDSDGYVRETGDSGARGLADINAEVTYKIVSGAVGLGATLGLTVPSHSDVGSTRSDQFGQLTFSLAPWGPLLPSVSYIVTRNGDPESAGGRSSQALGATLVYPWPGGANAKTRLDVNRAKPSHDLSVTKTVLSHSMDLWPAIGLKGNVKAVRSGGLWTNSLALLIEREL